MPRDPATLVTSSEASWDCSWRTIYRVGAAVALVSVAALLFDIVLASIPGWGPETAPATTASWLVQLFENPWLGLRNLDLLNASVSVVSLPLHLSLLAAHRRTEPGLAALGFALVATGTVLFAASNAALPVLALSRQYAVAAAADRAALEAAAAALLARGAHGSMGAFPGFLLSEVGTLVVALAMVRGRVFGRVAAWLGIVGAASLLAYSVLMTFAVVPPQTVVALAAPGGLAMIAWQVLVARRLVQLAKGSDAREDWTSASAPRSAAAVITPSAAAHAE